MRPAVPTNSEAAVFPFVTVRPARLSSAASNIITYQAEYASPFIEALTNQGSINLDAARAEGTTAVSITSSEIAVTLIQLDSLLQFGRWLRENQHTLDNESVSLVQEQLAPSLATPQQLGQLWEGLSRAVVEGNTKANNAPLLAVLRAHYFLDHLPATDRSAPELRALAAAEIVLPTGVLPPGRVSTSAPVRPNTIATSAALQKQASQQQQLTAYEQALAELRRLRDVRQEEARNASDAAVQQRADFIADRAALTPATLELVTELGSLTTLRLSFIISSLEAQAARLAQELSQSTAMLRSVFQVGGTLWAEQTPQELLLEEASRPTQQSPVILTRGDFSATDYVSTDFLTDEEGKSIAADDPYAGFYSDEYPNAGRIRPLGIADLNRVEQTLRCYKAGEVAHIENVMQGEYKERATRRLTRSEITVDQTTEREQTQERDTTTTDRNELTQEANRVLQQDASLSAGASVAGGFGPVNVSASSNFTSSSSSTQADQQTANYAKTVTDRSLQRIVEKVRVQRTSKLIEEFEENNKHGLDNRGGDKHVVGLYRWVDKLYQAQVVNYGKRLMFEFMVPEPGNFHLWAMSRAATQANISLTLPVDPRTTTLAGQDKPLSGAQAITPTNYLAWAAAYSVTVTPPPAETVVVTLAVDGSKKPDIARNSNTIMAGTADGLQVPEGYVASSVRMIADFQDVGEDGGVRPGVKINIGDIGVWWVEGANGGVQRGTWVEKALSPVTGKVAISYGVSFSERFIANIALTCTRMAATLDAWRIKTFQAIIEAYQNQKEAYDQAVADAQAGVAQVNAANPALNQKLIQNELKKGCLNWLFQGQQFGTYAVWRYGDDVNPPHYSTDAQAAADGERTKFMEQCFEWELLTYTLYPYYWANQGRWRPLYQLSDADSQLLEFLQSGMARVLVSVRPGYEQAAMYFLRTGKVWSGGEQPGIDSLIYRAIVDELKQPVGVRVGQPWEIRVPTTLTVLQAESGAIDGKGLPCDCEPASALGVDTMALLQAQAVTSTAA